MADDPIVEERGGMSDLKDDNAIWGD